MSIQVKSIDVYGIEERLRKAKDKEVLNYLKQLKEALKRQQELTTFALSRLRGKRELPDFGDYVLIEQKRFGVPNEMYLHKVVTRSHSNAWVDVPVMAADSKEKIHDEMEDVVWCICCGVCENEVLKYRLKDVKINQQDNAIKKPD